MPTNKKGGTLRYGKSGYKGARNLKGGKSPASKGVPTLKKGGRVFIKGK
jgi:hypothetical protein